ncbi:MAG TPA: hypothetical protein VEJ21_05260 [Acidimicrobiales bacterium]|nr:hypothetical protein [Acidimicrobiales bacterium]
MLHSRDFDTPAFDELELRHLYERALGRSAQLRARQARRRAAGATAALACLVVAGLVAASFAAATPGRRTAAGSPGRHATWRLVSEVSAAGSAWQVLSPSGYQQTFSLVCPSETTCYADSVGGQLEYTHDGGSTWQQAPGTGTATSLPQISCTGAQDCNVLAEIAGRGSTFLTTADGGQRWTSQPGPAVPGPSQNSLEQDAMSCATISSCAVIAYYGDSSGSSSEVFTTSDSGASWSQSTFPSPATGDFIPNGLSCTGTACVAVGSIVGPYFQSGSGSGNRAQGVTTLAGAAYTSDDGGATWSASAAPPSANAGQVTSLTCPDATNCYAVATGAVFQTEDGGQTWGQVSTSGLPGPPGSSPGWGFIAMSCATSSSCWLTGAAQPQPPPTPQYFSIGQAEGLLASTADGGSTWALSTVPAGVGGVIDVTCPGTSTCFALGVEQTGSAPSQSEVVLLTNAS